MEIVLSFLRLHPSNAFQTLLLTMRVTPFLLRCSCPQLWILLSSELNLPITVHFSSQNPKMMFTLVISFLTTSNLPWFINLTFQIPMQYCSLQHHTWLPPPDTSTTGCCLLFDSGPSFLLELFLCSFPVVFCHLLTREFIFQCHIFFAFSYYSWDSQGGLPFPSLVDHVFSELSTMTCLSGVTLHGMAHCFI